MSSVILRGMHGPRCLDTHYDSSEPNGKFLVKFYGYDMYITVTLVYQMPNSVYPFQSMIPD